VPVEFLSDAEAAAYGRYGGVPSRRELDRVFFLDDADRELIDERRGAANRLGYALQLTTVRWLGTFLPDPTDVPPGVLAYVAHQLKIEDPSCVARYLDRRRTRFEHAEDIKAAAGLRDFAAVNDEFEEWVAARSYMTGDGPRTIFADAVGWLRERHVLLPGVTTLARKVARARAEGDQRLWETLAALPSVPEALALEGLLDVAEGKRLSALERARKGPADPTGKSLRLALGRVRDVQGFRVDAERARALVPARRLVELARYGLQAKAPQLRRHPPARRTATLVATVCHLQAASVDDCLELFDLIMTTELLGKADRQTANKRARQHPRLARASAKLAAAVGKLLVVFASAETVRAEDLWREIEAVASRDELRAAVETVGELVPHVDEDDEGEAHAKLSERARLVSGFLRELCEVVELGSNAEGEPVLGEMRRMPFLLDHRRKLKASDIDDSLVSGSWWRLVHGQAGVVDRNAYVFCVLTQFHRHLKRRDIFAPKSSRWRDPRAQLLSGDAWQNAKGPVLRALGLPENPAELLANHAEALGRAYREVAMRVEAGTEVTVDDDGKLHLSALEAVPEPDSLVQLREVVQAMFPRVGLPEVVLEVMSWLPGFVESFSSASGGRSRLGDLHVSIAACLCAHAMNIDLTDLVKRGVPALERGRLSHVNQNYLRPEAYAAANPHLVDRQAGIAYAQALGGGLVADVDGMRFVVPVPSAFARPNRKYFGPDRGVTYLNMVSDQAVGLAAKVVSGAPRDSLHALDVAFSLDHGQRPDILVSDTGAYSDLMFGLCQPLLIDYRPQLADMPDQRLWRVDRHADYGPLNTAARGRLDLQKVEHHWPDILRVVASIYTGAVRAYDVTRVLQREGNPTPLGEAMQHYGRLFKSLHILQMIDDETYRRDVKWARNLHEGRHALGRKVFHGSKGELYQRYWEGMEDQLGALGLVLNCIVLWNTVYIDAALGQLRAAGYAVIDEDVRRLHPFMRRHIAVQGDYSFLLPALEGRLRGLRDPTEGQDQDDDGTDGFGHRAESRRLGGFIGA
jgi:TnpA family transposase